MEYIDKIKKTLCKELEVYGEKTKLTGADLDMIWKLSDTVKNFAKIVMLEEEGNSASRGYSRDGSSYGGSSYDDDMMYSERRGRGRYARRDSMGRYSSDNGSSYEYSEEDSYSRHDVKDQMLNKLGMMMESANPKEREALKECMRALEKA